MFVRACTFFAVILIGMYAHWSAEASFSKQKNYELSDTHSLVQIPFNVEVLTNSTNVVILSITDVTNKHLVPVDLNIYFQSAGHRWPAGNFSLYPPDHPATFSLRINPKIKTDMQGLSSGEKKDLKLCVEINPNTKNFFTNSPSVNVRLLPPVFTKVNP